MRGLNRVTLLGNLGNDPVMKMLNDGIHVTKISLATTEAYRLQNGNLHSDTQWHTIVFWRSLAELAAKYLRKGSLIYLEGRIRNRAYTDVAGNRRYVTEITGDRLIMLDKVIKAMRPGIDDDLIDDTIPF